MSNKNDIVKKSIKVRQTKFGMHLSSFVQNKNWHQKL